MRKLSGYERCMLEFLSLTNGSIFLFIGLSIIELSTEQFLYDDEFSHS